MNDILFTIIVPCCNVGKYVAETIRSIREQTYGNFECLLMCEESTDNTFDLCRQAAEEDSRFRFFSASRSGSPSLSRNKGIAMAQGSHILFVDGDDWLVQDALEHFAELLGNHQDVDLIAAAASEFAEADDGTLTFSCKRCNYLEEDDGKIFTGPQATAHIGQLHILPYPAIWLTLHRTEFLRKHNLQFIPGIIDEDEEWCPKALFLAKQVLVSDFKFYNYRRRPGSMSTSLKVRDLNAMAQVMRSLFAFYAQHEAEADWSVKSVWQRSWLSLFFLIFFFPYNQRGITEKIRRNELRFLLSEDGASNFRRFMKIANFPKRIATPLILLGRWWTLPACLYFKLIYYPLAKRLKS